MPAANEPARNLASVLIASALIIFGLVYGRDLLMPLAFATIIAFMLSPIVRVLTIWRTPRPLAVAIVMTMLICLVIAGSAIFSAQLLSLTASLSTYRDNLVNKIQLVQSAAGSFGNVIGRASDSIDLLISEFQRATRNGPPNSPTVVIAQGAELRYSAIWEHAREAFGALGLTILTLLLATVILASHHDIRDRIVKLAGTENMTATTAALTEAGARLSRLLLSQAATNAAFGLIVGVGLAMIGVPNPLLWATATAFLRFVPVIGIVLCAVPAILLAAAITLGPEKMLATAGLFIGGELVIGQAVEPRFFGSGVGMSTLALICAMAFWTLIWGPAGLLLAAPLTMCLVVVGQYIPPLEFFSAVLGDKPVLSPEHEFYHRLLANDPAAAEEQLQESRKTCSAASTSDRIILPALRIAARDYRARRLEGDGVAELRETMDSMVESFFLEHIPPAEPSLRAENNTARRKRVVVVPARGPIDALAGHFVAKFIERATLADCSAVEQSSGLLALADLQERRAENDIDTVLLSTVGGVDLKQLSFLAKRAAARLPAVRLWVCNWASADRVGSNGLAGSIPHSSYSKISEIVTLLNS